MEVFEAVRTLLAVREYRDKSVPPEGARRIVEAAWLSPSAANRQPWHFIAVDDRDTLRELGRIVQSGPYIAKAPFAVVVCVENTRFAVSDGSRAVQSMVLTAWADGIGSNWAGFSGLDATKPLLGIPDNLDVLCIVPFGYPARPRGKGKKERKPSRRSRAVTATVSRSASRAIARAARPPRVWALAVLVVLAAFSRHLTRAILGGYCCWQQHYGRLHQCK
jgi:nitroreductase